MTGIVKIKNLGSLVHCLLSYPKNPFQTLMGIEAEPSAGSILSGISQSAGFTPDAFTLTRIFPVDIVGTDAVSLTSTTSLLPYP